MNSTRSRLGGFVVVLAIIFLPVLNSYFRNLWTRDFYQFFPIAIATTLSLIWLRLGSRLPTQSNLSIGRVLIIVVTAVSVLCIGSFIDSPWLGYTAFVLMMAAGLCCFLDESGHRTLVYLIMPFLLTVRPPLMLDYSAVQGLQAVTSSQSSILLDVLGVDHFRAGNIIEPFGETPLLVEEACSGVQSLFTMLFLAVLMGLIHRYRLLRTLALMTVAVLAAGLMNTLRVTSIAVAAVWFDIDLAHGNAHELAGYAVLILATLVLVSADRLIYFLISPISSTASPEVNANPFVRLLNWFTRPFPDLPSIDCKNTTSFWILVVGLVLCTALMFPQYIKYLTA